jgi:hypothetical protein
MEVPMKLKFLVPFVLALSVLAVPALAYDYSYYDEAPINGSQLTDMPSQRANVTRTGSFLTAEPNYAQRYDYWTRHGYRDYYYDRGYYDRYDDRGW